MQVAGRSWEIDGGGSPGAKWTFGIRRIVFSGRDRGANMGAMEKIKEIEAEMARTQKNKATNYHLGTLKAKLAKLRSELLIEGGGGGGGRESWLRLDVPQYRNH